MLTHWTLLESYEGCSGIFPVSQLGDRVTEKFLVQDLNPCVWSRAHS